MGWMKGSEGSLSRLKREVANERLRESCLQKRGGEDINIDVPSKELAPPFPYPALLKGREVKRERHRRAASGESQSDAARSPTRQSSTFMALLIPGIPG